MSVVVLYGRPGCCLCDDAREVLERVRARAAVRARRARHRDATSGCCAPTSSAFRWSRSTASELFEFTVDEAVLRDRLARVRGVNARAASGRRAASRQRAPLARRRRAPLALPAGADAGAQDGPRDDLLARARRLHPRQLDPDPPRPLRASASSASAASATTSTRWSRRSARSCAPPASTTSRCSAPAISAARSPPRRSSPTTASASWRSSTPIRRRSASASASTLVRHNDELRAVVEEQDIVVGVLAVPTAAAQGLADDLVAAGVKIIFNYSDALLDVPPGDDRAHLEPGRRPAVRALLLSRLGVSTIDLDRAVETFAAATDFTVGLEEEFSILDPLTLELAPRFEELRDAAAVADPLLHQHITGELISSEIEIISGPRRRPADALRRQRERRRALFALAARPRRRAGRDRDPSVVGLPRPAGHRHAPLSPRRGRAQVRRLAQQHLQPARPRRHPRHRPRRARLRPDAARAAAAARRLGELAVPRRPPRRPALGAHADLHAQLPALRRAVRRSAAGAAFRDYIALLIRTNSIIEFTQIWWSVRPHFSYGTVEVRICDVQATAGRVRRAQRAGRGLRRPGGARGRRGRGGRRAAAGLPDRGEHVARDPPRARRQHDRLRRAARSTRRARSSSDCSPGPRRRAPRSGSSVEPCLGSPNGAQRQRAMIEARRLDARDLRDLRARHARDLFGGGSSMTDEASNRARRSCARRGRSSCARSHPPT